MVRRAYHASPKFIAPSARGLTLTAAEGESRRCLHRRDLGSGAEFISSEGPGLDDLDFEKGMLLLSTVFLVVIDRRSSYIF